MQLYFKTFNQKDNSFFPHIKEEILINKITSGMDFVTIY